LLTINPQYHHPGTINGNLGPAPQVNNNTELNTDRNVQILTSLFQGKLIKIRYTRDDGTQIRTWIDAALRGANGRLTQSIQNVPVEQSTFTDSRLAIYLFRKEHNLLRMDEYAANFSMDLQAIQGPGVTAQPWTILNNTAVISNNP